LLLLIQNFQSALLYAISTALYFPIQYVMTLDQHEVSWKDYQW